MKKCDRNNLSVFNCLDIFCTLIGSVVGVGFLTGTEIYNNFARFGWISLIGVAIVGGLILLLTISVFKNTIDNRNVINLYNFNKINYKNTFLNKAKLKNILLFLDIILMSGVMLSGVKTSINNLLNNNQTIIFITIILVLFFINLKGVKFYKFVSYLLTVLLIFIILALLNFCDFKRFDVNESFIQNTKVDFKNITLCFVMSILYVFMNVLQIQSVAFDIKVNSYNKKLNFVLIAFGIVFVVSIIVVTLFLYFNNYLSNYSMPIFNYFLSTNNLFVKGVYVIGLALGLLSTTSTCLSGVKNSYMNFGINDLFSSFLAVLGACLLGIFEFSKIISVVYPIVGVISMIIFVFL